jgi:hypothetical protein
MTTEKDNCYIGHLFVGQSWTQCFQDAAWVEKALKMNRVERKLAEMFRIHGIVPIVTPLLTPASVLAPVLAPNHVCAFNVLEEN